MPFTYSRRHRKNQRARNPSRPPLFAVLSSSSLVWSVLIMTALARAAAADGRTSCASSTFSRIIRPNCAFLSVRRYNKRVSMPTILPRESTSAIFMPKYRNARRHMPFSTHATPVLMSSEPSSSSAMHIFDVGDKVELAIDGQMEKGVITEARGSGWFTIRLASNDEVVKKRRGQFTLVDINGMKDAATTKVKEEDEIKVPAIIDIDAMLQVKDDTTISSSAPDIDIGQAAHHAKYDKWVIFSDLHCSPSSIGTCLEVLSTVHDEAARRNAGVIFLGDFWHHRGTVRIDTLNAVLRALAGWTVPLIMIPGNHDQVTLGGQEHGLTPLSNAFYVRDEDDGGSMHPGPLIFTYPTKFRDGFFVPYVRDSRILEHVLQSSTSAFSIAQFVHVDVTGAYMNDLMVSQGGVSLSLFPSDTPIYSGHFHKPHTVVAPKAAPGVAIRYVGSPYQTSLSEAGQTKDLLVVDASRGWKLVDTIPLSVGKRYHRIFSVDELLDLDGVAAKDRVVVSVTRDELSEAKQQLSEDGSLSPFDAKVRELRKLAASVEIRETKPTPLWPIRKQGLEENDISTVEDMAPENTLKAFLSQEQARGTMDESTTKELLLAGTSLVEGIASNDEHVQAAQANKYHSDGVSLEFSSVTAKGFGPFLDSVSYPLSDRGLVLLRGNNKDDGSDSNGSGKTTLAMAVLWALTGSSDPRPMQDSKVSDVINFMSKSARVRVEGTINDVPFKVTRIKTASKGSLAFSLDNEDLSRQSIKDTQFVIDEKLGISSQILARTIFHGQHAINGLLEATDATLKDELSLLVPLSIWQDAASFARKSHRSHNKRMSELDGMLSVRDQDRAALVERCKSAQKSADAYSQLFEARRKQVEDHLRSLQTSFKDFAVNETSIEDCRRNLEDAVSQVTDLESSLEELRSSREVALHELRTEVNNKIAHGSRFAKDVQGQKRLTDRAEIELERAKEKLAELQTMWGVTEAFDVNAPTMELPLTCPTCGQSIKDDGASHMHAELTSNIVEDIRATYQLVQNAEAQYASLHTISSTNAHEQRTIEEDINKAKQTLEEEEQVWAEKMKVAEMALKQGRKVQALRSAELQDAEKAYREATVLESTEAAAKAEIGRLESDAISSKTAHEALEEDLRKMEDMIRELGDERASAERSSRTLTRLADVFGPRGIQSFVLQNAVHSLSSLSQSYLDLLSDDTLRLELALESGDRISRKAYVRSPDGLWLDRPLSSLSGGQWRRCSLALSLGFSDLVVHQRNIRSSLMVLDEPLTHLDATGRAQVGKILRRLLHKNDEIESNLSTIIMILQDLAAEELEESFDSIDEVVRDDGISRVVLDGE